MPLPLPPVTSENLQFIVDQIAGALPALQGTRIQYGSGTCTWTASPTSATTNVTLTMGAIPTSVVLTSRDTTLTYCVTGGMSTTVLPVIGYHVTGTNLSATFTFFYLAIVAA